MYSSLPPQLFAVMYMWTYHYGRTAMAALGHAARHLFGQPHPPVAVRLAAVAIVLAVELVQSALLGPRVYAFLQENYMGTYLPQLLPTLEVLVLLTVAVLGLVVAVGPDPRPPRIIRIMGSTTLGCYVAHMYLTFPLSEISPEIALLPERIGLGVGLVLQLVWLIGVPLLVQLTIGIAFHWLLMIEVKALIWMTELAPGLVINVCLCARWRPRTWAVPSQEDNEQSTASQNRDKRSPRSFCKSMRV